MKKESKDMEKKKSRAGRKRLENPAVHVHYIYLNEMDSIRLDTLFHLSDFKYRGHFIRDRVLNYPPKTIVTDKVMTDFIIKLSELRGQFSAIGNNYNQLIKLLKEQLGEKKTLAFLHKLEQVTIEFVTQHREIEKLTNQLEERWLQK